MMWFCATHHLPTNDTWMFASRIAACRAREVLDNSAMSGLPTAEVLSALDAILVDFPSSVKLTGSYPHHEWQGDRIEGFVVSQGEELSASGDLTALAETLAAQVVRVPRVLDGMSSINKLSNQIQFFLDIVSPLIMRLSSTFFPESVYYSHGEGIV